MMQATFTGTESQISWAEEIRPRVEIEFERVARALRASAMGQSSDDQADTGAILAILDEKRAEVLAHQGAGYYIREWRELGDQVRRMLAKDARFQTIQAGRAARRLQKNGASDAV